MEMRVRIQLIFAILLFWSSLLSAETYYFSAPAEGEYATDLSNGIASAIDGDIFVLTTSGGNYTLNAILTVSANITIKSESRFQQPILIQGNNSLTSLFEITNGASLNIISVVLSGEKTGGNLENTIIISSTSDEVNSYSLIARNCIFGEVSGKAVYAARASYGENILFENCSFQKNRCIEFSLLDASYEASFASLEFQSCVFTSCDSGAFHLEDLSSGTHGSVLINHCVFDSVSRISPQKILSINGASEVIIANSVFSNSSTNASPFNLGAETSLDYCDFYRCADLGASTGANCLYYNPQYDSAFFVTNESLYSRANDGANIGPLTWVYSDDEQEVDTIDKGDNPHGYENQGVWIVPQPDSVGQWQSYFLKYNKNGKLKYRKDSLGDIIPDFSYVGYKYGNEPIPDVPIVASINPMEGDAADEIQRVIDSVGTNVPINANGIRGAILIKAGQYSLSKKISIPYSGIVLRGEGEDENGTVLTATSTIGSVTNRTKLIQLGASSGSLVKITASKQVISVPYIPVGAKYVIIPAGHDYVIGENICIYQQFNNDWVSDLKMDQIPPDGGDLNQWLASDYSFNFERKVNRISSGPFGDSLFFNNPVVMALDSKYNQYREIYKCSFNQRIKNSGVENMLLKSVYANDTDENHTWNAVYVDRAEDCWVRNVTSKYFAYACVNISSYAKQITVTKCTSLSPKSVVTGSRRYSFNCDGQTSLFSYCYASEGRHDYITGARVCGPNVFTNCEARNASNDIGPHHRWAVGTLFDVVNSDGEMNVRDRSNFGTGHGWAGANQVLWNSSAATGICQNPWVSAKNYAIGFTGTYVEDQTFGDRPRGEWEGANVPGLNPGSLYLAQKFDRNVFIDFGLLNSQLEFLNDSTFQIKFNQAVDSISAITPANYLASGSAGIAGNPDRAVLIDSVTIELSFSSFGLIKGGSQVSISVANIKNLNDNELVGLTDAALTVPHLEPIVSMVTQVVTNADDQFVVAQSNKAGDIFLIFITQVPNSVADLELAVEENMGTVARDIQAEADVQISTYMLDVGFYYAYAVDTNGRMSVKSSKSITVENLSLNNSAEILKLEPYVYYINDKIKININQKNFKSAKLDLYDLNGRLILSEKLYQNESHISTDIRESVYLVKLTIDNEAYSKKIVVTN